MAEIVESPFELLEADDNKVAANSETTVTLIGDGKQFRRRAVKKDMATGDVTHVEWVITEVDGVRVYVNAQGHVVLSKQDLWP